MTIVYTIAAFIVGGCCGVVLASILTAAGRADTPFQDLPGSAPHGTDGGSRAPTEPGSTPLKLLRPPVQADGKTQP